MVIQGLKGLTDTQQKLEDAIKEISKSIISSDKTDIIINNRVQTLEAHVVEIKANYKELVAKIESAKEADSKNELSQAEMNTKSRILFGGIMLIIGAIVSAVALGFSSGFVKMNVPSHEQVKYQEPVR